jgi:nicotinamidase-related amidase
MKPALLVIDVQAALFDGKYRPGDADGVLRCINQLMQRARAAAVPVIVVQHESVDARIEHGSAGWELAQGLDVTSADLRLRKTTPDSFLRTELQTWLRRLEVDHLVICGYASEFCVDTTTRSAAALGYPVTLAADAHTTHDKRHATAAQIRDHENATLPKLNAFGPSIRSLPTDQISFARL